MSVFHLTNEQIFEKYKIQLNFHENEKYFPCSIEYYLSNCQLHRGDTLLADYDTLTPDNILSYYDPKAKKLNLSVRKSAWDGQKKNLDYVPIYGTIKKNKEITLVQYIFICI